MNPIADRPSRRDLMISAGVFVLALLARVIYLCQIKESPLFEYLIGDSAGFDAWARRIAAGDWLGVDPSDPGITDQSVPIYPYFLGLVRKIVGHDYFKMRLVQMIVGAGSCVMLYWAGRVFLGRAAGTIAGLLLALYAPALFYDGLIQKGVLGLFLLCALLWLLGSVQLRPSVVRFFGTGVVLALLALDRENAMLLFFVVLAWIGWWFRARPVKARLIWAGTFLLGMSLVLVPVAVRNLQTIGRFALSGTNFGPAFYMGNNPRADGAYVPLRPGHGSSFYERQDARQIAEQELGRALSPREVSRYWLGRAWDYIRSSPLDWARLLCVKWMLVWNRLEITDTEDMYLYTEWSSILAVLGRVLHFGVVCPLAAAGIVWTVSGRRDLGLLYALLLCMAGGVALFLVLGRYRFPLVPVLLIFVGGALVQTRTLLRERRTKLLVAGCVVGLVVAILSNVSIRSRQSQDGLARMNLGTALSAQGRLDEAVRVLQEAIATDSTLAETHHNLGNVWSKKGDYAQATACYREALRLSPGLAESHNGLGDALRKLGRLDPALEEYRRAARLQPNDAVPHSGMGLTLTLLGRDREAVEQYEQATALDPSDASAYYNLGNALNRVGRSEDATEAYRRALRLDAGFAAAYYNLAATLMDMGHDEEALGVLRQGVEVAPRDREMRVLVERILTEHPELR